MKDENVTGMAPFFLRQQAAKIVLDLYRIALPGPTQARRHPFDVGVNHHSGDVEGIAEHHVGGLSADTGKRRQFLHSPWDFAGVAVEDGGCATDQVSSLVAIKSDRTDVLFQFCRVGTCVGFDGGILSEQIFGDLVHPHVGALSRENRGHQKFKGARKLKRDVRIVVGLFQNR